MKSVKSRTFGRCLQLVLSLIASFAYAGIETELYSAQYQDCTIHIAYDVVSDANSATILFRSFKPVAGLHHACSPSPEAVTDSLDKALTAYQANPSLLPVTSIMIGRLIDYAWIRQHLDKQARQYRGSGRKIDYREFRKSVMADPVLQPFQSALLPHGYMISHVVCEKLMYYDNGAPKDGLCGLSIRRRVQ